MEITLAKAIINTRRAIEREENRLNAMNKVASPEPIPQAGPSITLDEPMPAANSLRDQEDIRLSDVTLVSHSLGSATVDPRLRRPSTVTLSSLKSSRNDGPFPLKLDLSAASLGLDDNIIPGFFSPSALVTGLPPPSGIEAGASFAGELPVDLSQPIPGFSDGIDVDLTHDTNQDLTLSHSEPENLHLDQNMDNLFTEFASSNVEGDLPPGLGLSPPKGADNQQDHDKDIFSVNMEGTAGPSQANEAERSHIAEQLDAGKDISGGPDMLPLGHEFDHPDFASALSPSIFSQLDPSATTQFEGFKGDLDLESMADVFGGEMDQSPNPRGNGE